MQCLRYLFLYIPIVILVLFSFNSSDLPFAWEGFSLKWYHALVGNRADIWLALKNSLIVASASVVLSLVIGLLFVFYSTRTFWDTFLLCFMRVWQHRKLCLRWACLVCFHFFQCRLGLTDFIAGHTLIGLVTWCLFCILVIKSLINGIWKPRSILVQLKAKRCAE